MLFLSVSVQLIRLRIDMGRVNLQNGSVHWPSLLIGKYGHARVAYCQMWPLVTERVLNFLSAPISEADSQLHKIYKY